jgi:hypothetical protein
VFGLLIWYRHGHDLASFSRSSSASGCQKAVCASGEGVAARDAAAYAHLVKPDTSSNSAADRS